MPESSEVVAEAQAFASEYNDLRKDVLDTTLGHDHTGAAGEGKAIAGSDLVNWADIQYAEATLHIGNKDIVLEADERAFARIPSNMILREIHVRELGQLSGTATLTLYVYDGTTDTTATVIVTCSLSSAWNRVITGRSDDLQVDDWIELRASGTPTVVKQIAVALKFERL